jgi:hypothetical protein
MVDWKRGVLSGLMILASGCAAPDAFRAGLVERRIEWVNGNYHGKMVIPLARAEGIWKEEKWEKYARMDYVKSVENDLVGYGELVGVGVRYYPFSDLLGVEAGIEVFQAKAVSVWRYGPIKIEDPLKGYGYGFHIGLDSRIKLNDRFSFFMGAGKYFQENNFESIEIDADGLYATLGVEINLSRK